MEIQTIKISTHDKELVSGFMGEEYPLEIDFNWLMPVVEKIEGLGLFNFIISTPYVTIKHFSSKSISSIGLPPAVNKINAVWLACIDFIKWYNSTKNTLTNHER